MNNISEITIKGQWGANYDPQTKTMLGGHSSDGKTFNQKFKITEIEEYEMPHALSMCSVLSSKYDTINTNYVDLLEECEYQYSFPYTIEI